MKILVLGSGVIGVTTAYVLGARGHAVQVVDRNAATAMETSFANGGQLSYSHAEPWAAPQVLRKLPAWIFREDSPLIFRPRADLDMVKWGLQFLRNCTTQRAEMNTINGLRLALYSRTKMAAIREHSGVAFDFRENGILHLFSSQQEFEHAQRQNDLQTNHGGEQRVLSVDEVLALEPLLRNSQRTIVGGIHAFMDQSGDAKLYCEHLEAQCKQRFNTEFLYDTKVQGIEHDGHRILSVATSKGRLTADAYVMALGSYSPIYLKPLNIRLPIYPMKGYSVTLPADQLDLNMSLTDGKHKVVYSRLGNRIRAAGTAEFAGYDTGIRQSRIDPILHSSSTLFPQADWSNAAPWACLRPSTPDSTPYIGHTPYANLFLNTGHGTLGWTNAAGSAYIVADIITGHVPEIETSGLTLAARS